MARPGGVPAFRGVEAAPGSPGSPRPRRAGLAADDGVPRRAARGSEAWAPRRGGSTSAGDDVHADSDGHLRRPVWARRRPPLHASREAPPGAQRVNLHGAGAFRREGIGTWLRARVGPCRVGAPRERHSSASQRALFSRSSPAPRRVRARARPDCRAPRDSPGGDEIMRLVLGELRNARVERRAAGPLGAGESAETTRRRATRARFLAERVPAASARRRRHAGSDAARAQPSTSRCAAFVSGAEEPGAQQNRARGAAAARARGARRSVARLRPALRVGRSPSGDRERRAHRRGAGTQAAIPAASPRRHRGGVVVDRRSSAARTWPFSAVAASGGNDSLRRRVLVARARASRTFPLPAAAVAGGSPSRGARRRTRMLVAPGARGALSAASSTRPRARSTGGGEAGERGRRSADGQPDRSSSRCASRAAIRCTIRSARIGPSDRARCAPSTTAASTPAWALFRSMDERR